MNGCQQVGQIRQAQWDLAGHPLATRSQNQSTLGHPGAIRIILLHGESCNFSTTLPNMADGGKVYAFRSYHGRLRASTAVARRYGTGGTNRGNLLLNLVANKSIWASATCCIWSGRPLEGETTLFGWSGLAWVACQLPHSASLECIGL